jgi:hypothetical protein
MARREITLSSEVADRIIAMLEDGPKDPAGWREAMSWLEAESWPDVYAVLLFVLTQLDFSGPARAAASTWAPRSSTSRARTSAASGCSCAS